ncbi:MAG: hypothetical protein J6Q67_02310, partial [Clostridia bacterium]|nr:hypothetical protein [Clostridia bacterium]
CACGGKGIIENHTFGEWKVTSEASEVTPGEKVRECSVCGFEETAIIPATEDDAPDTGDKFVPVIWLAVLLMSGAGLSAVAAYRSRRKQR